MKKTNALSGISNRSDVLDTNERIKNLEHALALALADNQTLTKQVHDLAEAEKAHLTKISELTSWVDKLTEELANQRYARFGRKSETFAEGQLQLAIFNEVEALSDTGEPDQLEQAEQPEVATVQRKKKGGRKPTDISHLPVLEVIDHKIDNPTCPRCNSSMQEMGYEVIREVVHIPAVVGIKEHHVYKYICPACSGSASDNSDTGATQIIRAESPHLPLPKSMASASLIAEAIHQKFSLSVPVNRLVADLSKRANFPFTRQTVTAWIIAIYTRWLKLLYQSLQRELMKHSVLACDETTTTITHAPNRRIGTSSKSYIWIVSAPTANIKMSVYSVGPTRQHLVAQKLFQGWTGTLVADGYDAYDKLPEGIKRSSCLVHIRRKFVEVIEAQGGPQKAALTTDGKICGSAVLKIAAIYKADEAQDDESDNGIERRRKVKSLIDDLLSWCKTQVPLAKPGLKTSRALAYAINQLPHISECCLDPLVPLDNNASERLAKTFKVGAKNWQISDTMQGAEASACMYSLVTTAKANNIDPRSWLEWVLTEMPKLGEPQALTQEQIDSFLPWSDAVPESCKTVKKD